MSERVVEATTAPISRQQVADFAAAVGDHNPVHFDVEFARAAGLPDTIVHGPLTTALVLDVLVDQLGADEILNLDVRLRGPVFPGDELTVVPVLFGEQDHGVEVRNQSGQVVANGDRDHQRGPRRMNLDYLLVEDQAGGARVITLNRPDRFNSWNAAMRGEMRDVIEDSAMDALICVVGVHRRREGVLGRRGRLRDGPPDRLGTRGLRAVARSLHSLFDLIESIEIPVIAAVNGVAAGGGFELALSCDFRVDGAGRTVRDAGGEGRSDPRFRRVFYAWFVTSASAGPRSW